MFQEQPNQDFDLEKLPAFTARDGGKLVQLLDRTALYLPPKFAGAVSLLRHFCYLNVDNSDYR